MKRGTTPTNTFKTNIDLTGAAVFLTYSQRGRVVLEKAGDDLTVFEDAVVTRLTQKETLGFAATETFHDRAHVILRNFDRQIFNRLEFFSVNEFVDDFGLADLHFVTFPAHRFN